MIIRRCFLVVLLALAAALVGAQSWMTAYEDGLKAAGVGNWAAARAAFQQAVAYRPEDTASPTMLPGPVTDRKSWRGGSPYSPNFLAAYSEYRIGLSSKPDDAKPALQTAAAEFETLLNKNQDSRETFFFLDQIYTRLGDTAKRLDVEARFQKAKPDFRVDNSIVAPEEMTLITGAPSGPKGTGPQVTIIRPGQAAQPVPNGTVPGTGAVAPAVGPVPRIATKYALVIGNSTSQLPGSLTFGADDAQAVREALVSQAGYPEENVDLVVNTTKDQLLASAKALADRMPENATLFIFYAGNGVNVSGHDYLAGVDATSASDTTSMLPKLDLYQPFMAKAAKMYAFFEVPRPTVDGAYFGKEIPMVGAIAQVQSTIPGDEVYSQIVNGKPMGVFTNALVSALQDIRSNRIPIMEFGWQIYNRCRGGGMGIRGGGARQVPTLPVLTHMSDQDRF